MNEAIDILDITDIDSPFGLAVLPADETILTPISPSDGLITWPQAKAQLRLDGDDERPYVEGLLAVAADYAQDAMGCTLLARSRTAVFYTDGQIALPRGPLISVTSVTDANGAAVTGYTLCRVGFSDRVMFTATPKYPVTIVYQAGYATPADVPAAIKQAILMHAATLYESRESVTDKAKVSVPQTLADFYRLKSRVAGVG